MLTRKKKALILAGMFVLLVATAVLNYFINVKANDGDEDDASAVFASTSFFTGYRTNRQSTRSAELLILEEILATTSAEYAESREQAMAEKLAIVKRMEMEMELESLLLAKGYEDVVVSLGSQSENCNVMVKAQSLTAQDSAIIYTVVFEQAAIDLENVYVITV